MADEESPVTMEFGSNTESAPKGGEKRAKSTGYELPW